LLRRIGINGIWAYWDILACDKNNIELKEQMFETVTIYTESIKSLIIINPSLLLPIKDDQAIDISIALYSLSLDENNHAFIKKWIKEIIERSSFSYRVHDHYPCN
jgi:hypothetical protein